MWRYCIVSLLMVAPSCQVLAQNVVFSANANVNHTGVQDQIQVDYTIQNANDIRGFSKLDSKDFEITGGPFQSTSSTVTVINGKATQTIRSTFTYILHPRHTGNLTIPALTCIDGSGHSYQSNTLPLKVVPGSIAQQQRRQASPLDDFFNDDPYASMMQRRQQQIQRQQQALKQRQQQQQQIQSEINDEKDISKNIFIKVDVDKSKVHVGEQITASYKLYARIPMQISISKLPSLNGFWTQDFELPKGNIKPVEEVVDGKKYQVFLLKKSALFPQQTGMLQLDPAEAQGVARIIQHVQQRNPFADIFDNDPSMKGFSSLMMNDPFFNNDFFNTVAYKDVEVHIKSTPVKITVTQLPDNGKPADFGNAVGNFTLSTKIDKKELTTDDAANLTITIIGTGNLKLIEVPRLSLPNGLDTYDPQIIDTITGRTTTISGSKIITYSITPRTPGDYEIPPVIFSYFNPQKETYISLTTKPVKIHVRPGKHFIPQVTNNMALADIHNIATQPLQKLSFNSKPLLFTPVYWSMYGLPLLAFIGFAVWKRRDEDLSKDIVLMKNRRANKIALKRLNTAQRLLQQNSYKPFYEEVSKAIWLYLSDKFNIPLSALSHETAQVALNNRKVPAGLLQKIERVVSECETALYANVSSNAQMQHIYQDALNVISELEETI